MRETQDYSATPILADALQDADYPDDAILAELRTHQDEQAARRLVAIVYSDETASAVARIEELAKEMGKRALWEEGDGYDARVPVDYGRLMRVGDRWTEPWDYNGSVEHGTVEHGAEELRNGDLGIGWFDAFWKAYQAITGKVGEGNPFGCTC